MQLLSILWFQHSLDFYCHLHQALQKEREQGVRKNTHPFNFISLGQNSITQTSLLQGMLGNILQLYAHKVKENMDFSKWKQSLPQSLNLAFDDLSSFYLSHLSVSFCSRLSAFFAPNIFMTLHLQLPLARSILTLDYSFLYLSDPLDLISNVTY